MKMYGHRKPHNFPPRKVAFRHEDGRICELLLQFFHLRLGPNLPLNIFILVEIWGILGEFHEFHVAHVMPGFLAGQVMDDFCQNGMVLTENEMGF
jgi:hypothetical protein